MEKLETTKRYSMPCAVSCSCYVQIFTQATISHAFTLLILYLRQDVRYKLRTFNLERSERQS